MDIRTIWEFNAIALCLNMSAAARSLNVSQPTLSKHLAAAERELGVTLVNRVRGSQSMILTSAGEIFQEKGIDMLNIWNDLNVVLSKHKSSVMLTVGSSLEEVMRAPVMAMQDNLDFGESGIELRWKKPSVMPEQALRECSLDIAFEPISHRRDLRGLASIVLATEGMILMCHRDDELAKRDGVSVEALRGLRILSLLKPYALGLSDSIHEACNAHGFSPQFESFSSYESEVAMFAARLKPGRIAIIPCSFAQVYQHVVPQACFVPINDEAAVIKTGMLYRVEDSQVMQQVEDVALSVMQGYGKKIEKDM